MCGFSSVNWNGTVNTYPTFEIFLHISDYREKIPSSE
jgi:hypothetical protein